MNADAAISMQLRVEGEGIYDFLLHDVYSGGSLPEYFFSELFLQKVYSMLPGTKAREQGLRRLMNLQL